MKSKIAAVLLLVLAFNSGIVFADWIFGRASTARKAKHRMVGMSKERILECMGAPAQKEKVGETEVWSYHAGEIRPKWALLHLWVAEGSIWEVVRITIDTVTLVS